jgi:general secretion pathway protein A
MTILDTVYYKHYGMKEQPFQLAPDPNFIYLSKVHRRARAYMEYTVLNRDSFVVITGEIGSGKTTLIHDLLANMDSNVIVAKIHQTQLDELEFYQAVLVQFGLKPFHASKVELLGMLNNFLMEKSNQGKQVVLIIDEAQNLSSRVLEEVRLMTGLETDKGKIFNLILVGQPELKEIIESPGMEQLNQRIRFRFHLDALSETETREYINHRLNVAGLGDENLFNRNTIPVIHQYTGGIPRLINILCDTALISAFVDSKSKITVKMIEEVIMELQWTPYCDRTHKQIKNAELHQLDHVPPKLVISRSGTQDKEEITLDKEFVALGRLPGNDVLISDRAVSGHHAKIITTQGKSYIVDLESKNGTYVNNKRVERCRLKNGDAIILSPRKHMLEDGNVIAVASARLDFIDDDVRNNTNRNQIVNIATKK